MSTCIIHKDICALCGKGVEGGSDNGRLDIPAGGQMVVCLRCIAFGHDEAEAQPRRLAFEARRDVRS